MRKFEYEKEIDGELMKVDFPINTSAMVMLNYKQLTKKDLMKDLKTLSKETDFEILVDFLFCIAYSANRKLIYEDFINSIPLGFFFDEDFLDMIFKCFGIVFETTQQNKKKAQMMK
jgi:hypothetical protein